MCIRDREESLARYERGVALLKACQSKLAQAEQRVTMLIGELEAETGSVKELQAGEGEDV
jgi:exonuclease VII small subunit